MHDVVIVVVNVIDPHLLGAGDDKRSLARERRPHRLGCNRQVGVGPVGIVVIQLMEVKTNFVLIVDILQVADIESRPQDVRLRGTRERSQILILPGRAIRGVKLMDVPDGVLLVVNVQRRRRCKGNQPVIVDRLHF